MTTPPTDEELAEWAKLFGSAREGDDDTILNLCAIGWKLTQEVRRLREQRELITDIVKAAAQRSDELEAEVKRLKGLLEQWDDWSSGMPTPRS